LVQILGACGTDLLVQSDWQFGDLAVGLNLVSVLVLNRPGPFRTCFKLIVRGTALVVLRTHEVSPQEGLGFDPSDDHTPLKRGMRQVNPMSDWRRPCTAEGQKIESKLDSD
jgi:hypothetical protein